MSDAKPLDTNVAVEFICPRENQATRWGEYVLSLGRDQKGRLLAIITKGHPDLGGNTEVCDVEVVKDRTEAASWFGLALIERPWEPRQ